MKKRVKPYIFNEKEIATCNIKVQISCYPLTYDRYLLVTSKESIFNKIALNVLFIFFGFIAKIISVLIIYLYHSFNNDADLKILSKIESWETISCAILLVLVVTIYIAGRFITTKKTKAKNEIESFFNNQNQSEHESGLE